MINAEAVATAKTALFLRISISLMGTTEGTVLVVLS
jgi:hypothetical protein